MITVMAPMMATRLLVEALRVGGPVGGRQLGGMDDVIARGSEVPRQSWWQLCVDEEVHPARGTTRLIPAASAPNSSAASRSSRSRSE